MKLINETIERDDIFNTKILLVTIVDEGEEIYLHFKLIHLIKLN